MKTGAKRPIRADTDDDFEPVIAKKLDRPGIVVGGHDGGVIQDEGGGREVN
jgi:hypothetical protein